MFFEKKIYNNNIDINDYINNNFPNIIHLINVKELKDYETYFNIIGKKYKTFDIKIWNLNNIKLFINENYPFYSSLFSLTNINIEKKCIYLK